MPLYFTPLECLLARLNILPASLFDIPLAPGIAKVLVTSSCSSVVSRFELQASVAYIVRAASCTSTSS
jgi:hypothetical protein